MEYQDSNSEEEIISIHALREEGDQYAQKPLCNIL